jgi:hypothetical protein
MCIQIIQVAILRQPVVHAFSQPAMDNKDRKLSQAHTLRPTHPSQLHQPQKLKHPTPRNAPNTQNPLTQYLPPKPNFTLQTPPPCPYTQAKMKYFACVLAMVAAAPVSAEGFRSSLPERWLTSRASLHSSDTAKQVSDECDIATSNALAEIEYNKVVEDSEGLTSKSELEAFVCKYYPKVIGAYQKGQNDPACSSAADQSSIESSVAPFDARLDGVNCDGLSDGAIAGIVVGVLIVVGGIVFFVVRRNKKQELSRLLA